MTLGRAFQQARAQRSTCQYVITETSAEVRPKPKRRSPFCRWASCSSPYHTHDTAVSSYPYTRRLRKQKSSTFSTSPETKMALSASSCCKRAEGEGAVTHVRRRELTSFPSVSQPFSDTNDQHVCYCNRLHTQPTTTTRQVASTKHHFLFSAGNNIFQTQMNNQSTAWCHPPGLTASPVYREL